MADISVNAANVVASSAAVTGTGVAAETITAGMPVYADSTNAGKLTKGDANVTAACDIVGIALHAALAGQPLKYAISDPAFTPGITMGVTVANFATVPAVCVLSATAGGIAPLADLAAAMFPVVLYIATSATVCKLNIIRGSTVFA